MPPQLVENRLAQDRSTARQQLSQPRPEAGEYVLGYVVLARDEDVRVKQVALRLRHLFEVLPEYFRKLGALRPVRS